MANVWSAPNQQDHVPFTPDSPVPADQWQNATLLNLLKERTRQQSNNQWCYRIPGPNASSCMHRYLTAALSSSDRYSSLKESVVPHAEQNVGAAYPTGVTATVDFPTQEWTFAPQALYQNSEYAFRHDAVDSLQIEMDMVLNNGALDLSVPERLRRLARRYINNPDSTVNGVHLESGPSGRFQVVITIGDVLGDVMN